MKRIGFIFTLILLLTNVIFASNSKVGTTSATFLKIGTGSRPMGMGGTYTGISKDINSIYWNPGGLSFIRDNEIILQHIKWFQDIKHEYLAYGKSFGYYNAIGISLTYLYMDDIEKRSETNLSDTPDGVFGANDIAFTVCYSKKIKQNLGLGFNFKYIQQTIDTTQASGYALDAGLLCTCSDNFSLGIAVFNIGNAIKFIEDSSLLPMNFKLGLGYSLIENVMLLAMDVNYPNDSDINASFGVEFLIPFINNSNMPIRAGYKTKNDLEDANGLSAGIGFEKEGYSLDFAWVPYGDLGDTYRVSLLIKW